jgi:hypothetical protein
MSWKCWLSRLSCCWCYGLLQKSNFKKSQLMSGRGVTIYGIPALKTLLETPWMALAGVATRQDARMLLKNVHGLSTLGDICIAKNFCLQWDDDCPSCFQYEFDGPLPAIGTLFSSWQPSFERTSIVLHDCAVLDDITGEEIKILKSFHVRLLCHLRTRMS